jgi:cyclophilin family peptidyl-prolyl cis-trans isomerase
VYLLTRSSNKSAAATTTTTTSTTTTTTLPPHFAHQQAVVDAVAAAAGCPKLPSTPTNTLSWPQAPMGNINITGKYSAVFKTDIGSFTVALDASKAPITVNNFIFLVKSGYYKCGSFFRVIPGFASQSGSPNQTNRNTAQPGYTIPDENKQSKFALGDLAMANTGGPHTGGSQFFIVAKAQTIGGTYALFGHVTHGLAVINKINADGNANTYPDGSSYPPNVTHRILSITIVGP